MTTKFKIGDKVISSFFKDIFIICKIEITASETLYLDINNNTYSEETLTLYTEPKPKVKKYLWAYKDGFGHHSISRGFYKDVQEFEKVVNSQWFQRLDWSMTEVPDDSKD